MPYNNVKFVFIIIFALVVDKVALLNISDEVKSICGIPQKSPKLKLKSRVSGGTESFHGNYPWYYHQNNTSNIIFGDLSFFSMKACCNYGETS